MPASFVFELTVEKIKVPGLYEKMAPLIDPFVVLSSKLNTTVGQVF